MTNEKRIQIKAEEVCEVLHIAPATLGRWLDPKGEWYRPDFPAARRYPRSFTRWWYLDEILKWREENLVAR